MLNKNEWVTCIADCEQVDNCAKLAVSGTIIEVDPIPHKKRNMMAFAILSDVTGRIRLVCFSDAYRNCRDCLKEDQRVRVIGPACKA